MRYLLVIQLLILLVACGAIDQAGDQYYHQPITKASKWIDVRKQEDEEYRRERHKYQQAGTEEMQEWVTSKLGEYCEEQPEICEEIESVSGLSRDEVLK